MNLPNNKAPGPDKITDKKPIVQLYYMYKACLNLAYCMENRDDYTRIKSRYLHLQLQASPSYSYQKVPHSHLAIVWLPT